MSLTLYPLGDYIQLLQRKNLQLEFSGAPLTREVSLVSCDSRQVVPGTLFILLPMADQPLLHGGYTWLLKQIMILATGHTETGVFLWIPITTALVCSVLCLLAAWGMMRRAEVK